MHEHEPDHVLSHEVDGLTGDHGETPSARQRGDVEVRWVRQGGWIDNDPMRFDLVVP
jgi:hypothetical protein